MCFFGGAPKPPKVPPPKPAPLEADQKGPLVTKARKTAAEQKGVLGNIFTSALGDSDYGSNIR
jgi:hypothetical protein